jgi:hypothetical protein
MSGQQMEIVRPVLFQVFMGHYVQPCGLLCVYYLHLFPAGKLHFNKWCHSISVFRVANFVLLV